MLNSLCYSVEGADFRYQAPSSLKQRGLGEKPENSIIGGESSFLVLEQVGGGAGRAFVLRRGAIFCTWAGDFFFFGLWYITTYSHLRVRPRDLDRQSG